MTETVGTLMDWLRNLLQDPEARAEFEANPQQTLQDHGFEHLTAEDVQDALPLVVDDIQDASFDRSYDTGGNTTVQGAGYDAPPPPDPQPLPGESELEAAIRQINYITNNYSYTDDRDTITDNSVNQQILAGGDVSQVFDNDPTVVSGDGAVGIGADADVTDSNIVTGDGNQVGDVIGEGNVVGDRNEAVTGDGNTTAFGSGDATSATSFGSGDATAANLDDVTVDDNDTTTNVGTSGGDTNVNVADDGSVAAQNVDQSDDDVVQSDNVSQDSSASQSDVVDSF